MKKSSISEKVRGDGITIDPIEDDDVKKKRFKLNSGIDVRPYHLAGIKSIELKAKRYGRNDFVWSLEDGRSGSLDLRLKSVASGAHKGFYVENVLVDKNGDTKSKGMRIDFN